MEKIEMKREFNDFENRDFDDVLDNAYFSRDDMEDLDEDESNYEYRDSEFRSISEL
ncbi:MAG: hypothetical protein RIA62_04620 [Cyclobacteriaceae bacterium]|tara:strand:+ start:4412 stop:4579 length:168 start_codon:yes stop_codon:yes gene_type:complete